MAANGEMLRLARQRRLLPQITAAKKLGVEQPFLSRIENGLVEARDDFLLKAAQEYAVPRSFFLQSDPVYGAPVSVHPMWRRKADVSGRELDGVVAELNILAMHLRRLLQGAEVVHANDVPRMDIEEYKSDARKIAGLVRAHWKLPAGPIKNLTVIAERAGIVVVHSELGGASISGVTFSPPGLPRIIVLNSDQPADRMRFTLAHEIAHMVMHRFPTPNMEQEAHNFASALLMPENELRPYFAGRKVDLQLLASLKPVWKVSMAGLLKTAESIGVVSRNQAVYLWKQMSARGLRLREPPELDLEREVPQVLSGLVNVHLNSLGYSTGELATFLNELESEFSRAYTVKKDTKPERVKLSIVG
jgi:Zn-dependent peptidase ImmA (M78 family)